jgi:hypothetical protein
MLLLPNVKYAMDLLVHTRQENNIAQQNQFFFASDSADGHLCQHTVLKRIAVEANLEKSDLFRSTKLREYLATMAQVGMCFITLSVS